MKKNSRQAIVVSSILLLCAGNCLADDRQTFRAGGNLLAAGEIKQPAVQVKKSASLSKAGSVPPAAKTAGTFKTTLTSPGRTAPVKSKKPTGTAKAAGRPGTTRAAKAATAPESVTRDGKPIWLDLKSARLAAKLRHKPVFADFYTDWCSWCKYMDKTTFVNPKVQAYLAENVICTKLNAQDSGDGEELAQRFQMDCYPTYMVFDAQGKPLGKFSGYHDPDRLISSIKASLSFRQTATTARSNNP